MWDQPLSVDGRICSAGKNELDGCCLMFGPRGVCECVRAVSVPLKRVRQEDHDTRSEKHCLSLEKFWLFYVLRCHKTTRLAVPSFLNMFTLGSL